MGWTNYPQGTKQDLRPGSWLGLEFIVSRLGKIPVARMYWPILVRQSSTVARLSIRLIKKTSKYGPLAIYPKVNPSSKCRKLFVDLKPNVLHGESPDCWVQIDKITLPNLKVSLRRRVLKNEHGRQWNSKITNLLWSDQCWVYPKKTKDVPSPLASWISSTPPFLEICNCQHAIGVADLIPYPWPYPSIPYPISSNLGSMDR
jgi:hypothetical protein